ncbi:MAG TPA: ABC transporter permease [Blastocatellia bacterium]|nr:ABC transporter permease [Blastocatellia bacterium]
MPRRLRADWRQEWEAELQRHEQLLAEWDKLDRRNRLALLWHSLGAFMDALWLQPRRMEDEMLQDLRYGVRMLLKSPAFTLAAIVSLAIGIGANTAVFSVVNAVLWRPLPYAAAERLVEVAGGRGYAKWFTAPDFVELSKRNRTLDHLSASVLREFVITGGAAPEQLRGQRISSDLLALLGVMPQPGRAFAVEEFEPGHEQVVLISHRIWKNRFDQDPQIIGQVVTLDERSYTVIGVLPPQFNFFPATDLLVPLALTVGDPSSAGAHDLAVVGRLKPDQTIERAERELNEVTRSFPNPRNVRLSALRDELVKDFRLTLFVLWGMVVLVLLIACANFANLLLARVANRQKELAIRSAIGARRARIMRQLLTESVLLAVVGGFVGLLCARFGVDALLAASPANISNFGLTVSGLTVSPASLPRLNEVGIASRSGWAIAFTIVLALLTGVICGLVPALQCSKPDLQHALKEGAAVSGAGFGLWSRHRIRSLLVIAEIALSLVLLIGAGLLAKSFWRLQQVKPGFQPERVLTMQLEFSWYRYPSDAMVISFVQTLKENLMTIPGVQSVGATSNLPLTKAGGFGFFSIEGRPNIAQNFEDDMPFGLPPPPAPPPGPGGERIQALMAFNSKVGPDYFRTMGVPVLRGREFDQRDNKDSPLVVIINEAMANRHWPGEDPIGKRIKLGAAQVSLPWLTIVGVVGNVKHYALEDKTRPEFYRAFHQSADRRPIEAKKLTAIRIVDRVSLVMRVVGSPEDVASAARELVWSFDRDQPISRLITMEELLNEAVAPRRFNMVLFGALASVALVLASVGIYGVMAYTVTQRTHEIGIRMAFGARTYDVLRLVVGQGMTLAATGMLLGLATALALTRLIKGWLFGISATDPLTFAALAFLLTIVALLACYIPARRATKVDPMIALRHE